MTRSAVLPFALALVTALSLGACKRSDNTTPTGSGTTSSTTGSSTSSMAASSPASAASQ